MTGNNTLGRSVACLTALWVLLGAVAWAQPLRLERSISLPGVEGRIDHMAVDMAGGRLFVAALGNHTIEVIDLAGGRVASRISGLGEPQGLAYAPELGRLFAADGEDGTCRIYDGRTLKLLEAVKLGSDADNVRYDAARKQIWVGYGDGALAALDATTGRRLGEVKLDGHPESFQLEPGGPRIFVNVPSAGHLAVVDRVEHRVVGKWQLTGAAANFPMALDAAAQRLFIGCRKPPEVLTFSWAGKRIESRPIHGDTDDLFWDAKRSRLYVSCGEGYLDVLEGTRVSIATAPGARTSLFVPQTDRLYLAVPHRGAQRAEIRVYRAE